MNQITKNIWLISFTLFSSALFTLLGIFVSTKAQAEKIWQNSILCDNEDLYTSIGMNTKDYNVALCKGERGDDYFIFVQNRQTNDLKVLPATNVNSAYHNNPWIAKSKDGFYTYQFAEFDPLNEGSKASFSIFENGTRIYHYFTDTYLIGDYF